VVGYCPVNIDARDGMQTTEVGWHRS
jgi:hypothetical protein